jgi:alkanesulfonate monooxygenase SsuD/methylene tetrahydromethanopterin reductase-like flavin-dependent oxidoreductase (luciferase family)
MYQEALQILRLGLTRDRLTFHGEFYRFTDVPMELGPRQKPHPPFWMGVGTPDAAETAARNGFNMVALQPAPQVGPMTARYRAVWRQAQPAGHEPKIGLGRFVIMAETDDEALAVARRAYPLWHAHFHHLYHLHGRSAVLGDRPPDFDQIKDGGRGIAGSPATVIRMLKAQLAEAGANYFVGQFAFGDLTLAESLRSVELFVREVMPALRQAPGRGGNGARDPAAADARAEEAAL